MSRFRNTGSSISKSTPAVLTVIFWAVIIFVISAVVGVGIYEFTAPAMVGIQNRTFHQSQAYNDGMARDLEDMRLEYMNATPAGKDVLRATIRHRYTGYNASTLPPDLQAFLSEMFS